MALWTAGFGSMYRLWRTGEWPDSLPGLLSYRSATWGDGALLPIAAAGLSRATGAMPSVPGERAWSASGAVVGAVIGAGTQVAWLRDPSPELNWTLPAPHHFNRAGWYHAGFLVATSGYLAGQWALAASRLRGMQRAGLDRRPALVGLVAALGAQCGFAALVLADNGVAPETRAHRATGLGLGVATAALAGVAMVSLRGQPAGADLDRPDDPAHPAGS